MKVPVELKEGKLIDADGKNILEDKAESDLLLLCVNRYPATSQRVGELFEKTAGLLNILIGAKFMNDTIRDAYKLIGRYIEEDSPDLHLYHFRFEIEVTLEDGKKVKNPGSYFIPCKDLDDLASKIHVDIAKQLEGKLPGKIDSNTITDCRDKDFNNITEELKNLLKKLESEQVLENKEEKEEK